jgi:hypothetical protein
MKKKEFAIQVQKLALPPPMKFLIKRVNDIVRPKESYQE